MLDFLTMLSLLVEAGSWSIAATGNDSLPPYPTMGLAWMMHGLDRPYPTLTEIQVLHCLVTSATSPSTAKLLETLPYMNRPTTGSLPITLLTSTLPVIPSGLGIAPKMDVLIKPHPPVLLSP